MVEHKHITCKVCKVIHLAIMDGKYPDGVNKRWKDKEGRLFNGKTCPNCQADKMKLHQRVKRANTN